MSCTSALASGCTKVTCNEPYSNKNSDAADGCEHDTSNDCECRPCGSYNPMTSPSGICASASTLCSDATAVAATSNSGCYNTECSDNRGCMCGTRTCAAAGATAITPTTSCAAVANGLCTACTSALSAGGCLAVMCDEYKFDTNGDATDGCEEGCASVADGMCTACTSTSLSGCIAVTCHARSSWNEGSDGSGYCRRAWSSQT